jgi:hypothetical protein
MKITLKTIYECINELKELDGMTFKPKEAYIVLNIIERCNVELEKINKYKQNLVEKAGVSDGNITPAHSEYSNLLNDLDTFLDTQVEFDEEKINIESINEMVSSNFLRKLNWLFTK